MATRESAPIGAPCWVELMTSDVEKSRAFYAAVFGWESEDPNPDFGGYFNFNKGGVRVAGGMQSQPGQPVTDTWNVYLASDDAQKTVEAAATAGAQVIVPASEVMDLGVMAVVIDPSGATTGIWQPGTHKGFGLISEPGAPSWFALASAAYAESVSFYRNVFRWDAEEITGGPGFTFTGLKDGDDVIAGIMDASYLPEGTPASWAIFFGTEDTDASLAKVVELGGSVVRPAEDTPYGRLAAAADPNGAQFSLVAPNEAMPAK